MTTSETFPAEVKLSELFAPDFLPLHTDVRAEGHTHYWLKGGRGSTKSSFVSLELVLSLMRDGQAGQETNAIVFRRFGVTIRESVYEQIAWAIRRLGVSRWWEAGLSPMQFTYLPTGQKILFRGMDDAAKLKSVKMRKGYLKYTWFEEANELESPEKLRNLLQSVNRGGASFLNFYTFNPPKEAFCWINRYLQAVRPDMLVHHSDYRSVPPEWLGDAFFQEAEHLKRVNPAAYRHEYLGEVIGDGGEVFDNLSLRLITDEEIGRFDQLRRGIDWGYAADPFHYAVCHFDRTRRRLFLFREIRQVRLSNRAAAERIRGEAGTGRIICDSAEPKSIDEMRSYGLRVTGARKGPDSVEYGIKFLQDLEQIVIDPERCPETAREFSGYRLERDREGNFKASFPDRNNHSIDAVRYALEEDMRSPAISILK